MDNQYLLLALLLVPALYVVRAKLSNARTVNVSVPVLGKPTKPVNRKDVNEDNIVVSQIWVFPIKSCRGTSVQQARLSPVGFQYDRKWSIVTAQDHNVISLRAYPQLTHIIPQIQEDPNSPFGGLLIVQVPSGENDGVTHTFSVPLNPPPDMLESWDYLEDVMPLWFKAHMDGYICQSISGDSRSPSAILSKFLKKDVLLVMKGPQDRSCPRSEMFPDLKATMTYCVCSNVLRSHGPEYCADRPVGHIPGPFCHTGKSGLAHSRREPLRPGERESQRRLWSSRPDLGESQSPDRTVSAELGV
ncbi:hypothetical protein BXZ70DRAFT_74753 [Cristinia sonorae]|uniref:Molybdenum cofactor sulfurase middle domain-containing protein n=1 Tax=Cristinia sonorae TaxID=1940300 RepID=A0A8K0URC4_9AGAR|nr:hypothetical protein BXZ70DRAFT_74753 [Cristinia sonorae]